MDTLQEMREAVQSDLNVSSNSSLYPPNTIDKALNRAYVKGSRLFRWPALEDAKYTTTQTNINYYDFPDVWTPDSAWMVTLTPSGGTEALYGESPDGSPLSFKDFRKYKLDYPNSTEKKWAMQHLRVFITPTPTDATTQLTVWAQKNATLMTVGDDSAETIFSKSLPECNEALVLEASAILKKKGTDKDGGEMLSAEAKQILAVSFGKIRQEQAKIEKNLPMFDVPDMYGGQAPQVTGNFTNTRSLING